jgi:hypothetical protein
MRHFTSLFNSFKSIDQPMFVDLWPHLHALTQRELEVDLALKREDQSASHKLARKSHHTH